MEKHVPVNQIVHVPVERIVEVERIVVQEKAVDVEKVKISARSNVSMIRSLIRKPVATYNLGCITGY